MYEMLKLLSRNRKVSKSIRKEILRNLNSTFTFLELESFSNYISDVNITKQNNIYTLELVTFRPGIIIGKGGRCINDIKETLSSIIKYDIEITIKENKLWYDIYR